MRRHMQNASDSKAERAERDTQRSLILRLHDWNDRQSWNTFYHNYHKLVYAVARKSGLSEAEAWDVVQETFVSIAKQSLKGSYKPEQGSFKSWLLHVTHWRINDQLRNRRQEAEGNPPSDIPDSRGEGFDKLWELEWQQNLVHAAVARVRLKVSPRQFQIFDYHILQGMEVAEVCRKLSVSPARVYLAKHRVGAQLRHEIEELRQAEG